MGSLNPILFPIRWKKHCRQVKSIFHSLRNDEDFTDVTILCHDGQETGTLHSFAAHQVIMAANSRILRTMLKGLNKDDPNIYLHGVNSRLFQYILDFIYFGEVLLTDKEELADLVSLATDLDITGLKDEATKEDFDMDYEVPKKRLNFILGNTNASLADLTKPQWSMEEMDTDEYGGEDETEEDTNGLALKPEKVEKVEKVISVESQYRGIAKRGNEWQCLECGKMFSRIDNANRHLNLIHRAEEQPKVQCHICQKVVKNIQYAKEHMRVVHKIVHSRQKSAKPEKKRKSKDEQRKVAKVKSELDNQNEEDN